LANRAGVHGAVAAAFAIRSGRRRAWVVTSLTRVLPTIAGGMFESTLELCCGVVVARTWLEKPSAETSTDVDVDVIAVAMDDPPTDRVARLRQQHPDAEILLLGDTGRTRDLPSGTFDIEDFSADEDRGEVKDFVRRYRDAYGSIPETTAALGYDLSRLVL